MAFIISGSSLTLISRFLLILNNFENVYLNLNIHISVKRQLKIKSKISKFTSAHWQIRKSFSFENFSCVVHFTLDRTGVFFVGHPVFNESVLIIVPSQCLLNQLFSFRVYFFPRFWQFLTVLSLKIKKTNSKQCSFGS